MEAANKTECRDVRPIASMVLLWIINAILLIHNFFYLAIEGINTMYGKSQKGRCGSLELNGYDICGRYRCRSEPH